MKATIKTIADMTNTSSATVSRTLARKGYVKEETRSRIEAAVRETGYQYKRTKQISADQTKKIVLVVSANLNSQIYIEYFKGLTAYLSEKGYYCLEAFSNADPRREVQYIKFAANNQFGAVVLLNVAETPELVALLPSITCPVVFVNRYLRAADVDAICVDNYRGGYAATKCLIDAGHRHILHLTGNPNSVVTQDRLLGFHDAMQDAHLPISDEDIFQGDLTEEGGERLGDYLAKNRDRYTAAFVSNDSMAVGLLNSLYEHGMKVPDDISIVSFDTTPIVKNARVKLTTIGFSSYEMGVAAGELVNQRIHLGGSTPRKIVYPATIDYGESVRIIDPE